MGALADFLLAAPAERPRRRAVPAAPAPLVRGAGVLAGGGDAAAAGAMVAAALARRCAARCALVCVHDRGAAGQGLRLPAAPAARRLAATLAARGHEATASGRLAGVTLDPDPVAAAAQACRAIAAAGDAPVVLALGGTRDEAFDALLRDRDVVLVVLRDAAASAALAALAVAGAEALGVPVARYALPRSPLARALAAAGVAVPAHLREILERAVVAA